MAINTPVTVNPLVPEPYDARTERNTIAERNAIDIAVRHPGLSCYILNEDKRYTLVGGVTNAHWVLQPMILNDFGVSEQTGITNTIDFNFNYGRVTLAAGAQLNISAFSNTALGRKFTLVVTSNNVAATGSYHIINPTSTTVVAGTLITGTVTVVGTAMTGSGTNFLSLGLSIGSVIRTPSNVYTVTSIAGLTTNTGTITVTAGGNVSNVIGVVASGSQVTSPNFVNGTVILLGAQTRIINTTNIATHTFTITAGNNIVSYRNLLQRGNLIIFPVSVKAAGSFISGRVNYIEFECMPDSSILAKIYAP